MATRIVVGVSLAIVLIGALLTGGWMSARPAPHWPIPGTPVDLGPWLTNGLITTLIVLVLTVRAVHELVLLARARGYHPFGRTAQFFAAILVMGPYVSYNISPLIGIKYDESWGLLWMAIALGFVFILQAILHRTVNAMENLATTIFIIFYVGGLAGFMTKLRMEVGGSTGVIVLLFSVFLVKMTDTGAYFVGSFFGRNKMVPWLSPKKTWEGFAGGMVVTALCAVLIGHALRGAGLVELVDPQLPFTYAMLMLGILLGLFSAAGDLSASLLKRDAAVKDSGRTLPGLGGVLDIFDSPLLGAPVAWVFWTRLFHVAVTGT